MALARLPRLLVPLLLGILVVVALAAPPAVGVPALVLVLVFVGWLTYLAWPATTPAGRGVRVVVLVGLVAYGVARLLGRL